MNKIAILVLTVIFAASFFLSLQMAESKISGPQPAADLKPHFMQAFASGRSETVESFAAIGIKASLALSVSDSTPLQPMRGYGPFTSLPEGTVHDSDAAPANIFGLQMPPPSLSFDGLSNRDNVTAYNLLIIPPDMIGDVGPDHYVQAVNSLVRIFNKNGVPLTEPFKFSDIFAPLGTPCSVRNDGLPNVLYDSLADRWLIGQICTNFPPFRQMVAVSVTGDPTGSYFIYEFVMPNVKLNDFPKFGVWPDGYYMSTDEFLGSDFVGSGAFAFDRAKMLAGDQAAGYIYFNLPVPVQMRRRGLLPSDLDGLNPPPAGAPNIFAGYTATEYGDPQDAIRLFDFRADFTNPANSTFTEQSGSPIPVAAFDPTSPDGRPDISQPPPGEKLDSQSDRLNYRLAYRNFGTHESLVVNQTVRLTPPDQVYRAGVRVYELRRSGVGFAPFEQATLGDTGSSRWIGAAAQDHLGNLAVEYNFVDDLSEPSIRYSGRLATDPPGTFRPESALIKGTGVQKAFGWRWGEYSGMSVDPVDDCTFWMTNAYYTQDSEDFSDFGWLTRIGRFKFVECSAAPRAVITGIVTNSANAGPLLNATVKSSAYSRNTNSTGSYGNLTMLPGTYQVTASAKGFRSETFTVTITNGQTFIQNFSLQPIAVLEDAGTTITAESCRINNAAEPGETVTINISLRNTGAADTQNLTATLLASGGVAMPGPPQNYGALPTGGASVSRPFTFTVSPDVECGSTVVLKLALQDGDENLGNISIDLRAGEQRIALRENFDSVAAPNLPSGWMTSSSPAHELWRTSASRSQSAPNSLFSPDPRQQGINEVITPSFAVETNNAEISFRNWYELETTFLRNRLYDGSVLEIKIGGGAWQDILAAGGVFLSGGYDGVIDSCCQNPLAGRLGWSGRSGLNQTPEFITSRAKLPASSAGQNVQLRWRIGTDIGGFREGQYIDDLVVTDGYSCGCPSQSNKAPFDFDGDGKTDLSVVNFSDDVSQPDFRLLNSSNGIIENVSFGSTGDIPANADFDGDGKTDIAIFRPSSGVWYVLKSSDLSILIVSFGLAGDRPVPSDYDGDRKDDVAVFRPSQGVWYVLRSSDLQVFVIAFGQAGDLPVPADYDGDGNSDIAVFRPSTGVWYISRTSDSSFSIVQFGLNGDRPAAGDFDGDGKADLTVFRPNDGVWYILRSNTGFGAFQFGLSEDRPLQADLDGDGIRDIAVFRPSSNVWYYIKSSNGDTSIRQFGGNGDTPVPGIFVNE